ncbi:hypothetical protein BRADI_4g36150v3 [Brachypodium distachyon]|uniref:Uncharacterized protein n=1 Tax=Brachypodium distachyon TaxID=15368 RepID=A0A0Q3IYK0_BRADI|nr:hypothetical protein BRADI_4g36150v3 [Brachypodium distachyon]
MIYRRWSLLSSTVAIWGGAAAAGIAASYLFGGKEKLEDYMLHEGDRLRQQDKATWPTPMDRERKGPRGKTKRASHFHDFIKTSTMP